MTEPTWIKQDIIIAIQKELIVEHGGLEGIRESALLESACHAPQQLYHYSNPKSCIGALAAKYAYSIIRNHPFFDCNKRVALVSLLIFLDINGHELNATESELYIVMIDLAAGKIPEKDFTKWIKHHIKKL